MIQAYTPNDLPLPDYVVKIKDFGWDYLSDCYQFRVYLYTGAKLMVKIPGEELDKYPSYADSPHELIWIRVRKWMLKHNVPLTPCGQSVKMEEPVKQATLGDVVPEIMQEVMPDLQKKLDCPGLSTNNGRCVYENRELFYIIIHLNDCHKWTREQIADWLDALDLDLQFKEQENV